MQCLRHVCVCVCASVQLMMTLTASANILYSSVHNRWLTLREIIGLQGFPVDCKHTWGQPCSSYAARAWGQERGKEMPPWPSRRSACSQAGNSMHVSVSGLVLLFALTQVGVDPELMLLQQEFQKQRFAMMACSVRMSQSPRSSAPARSPNSVRSP